MPVRVRLRAQVRLWRWLLRVFWAFGILIVSVILGFRLFLATEAGGRWARFFIVGHLQDDLNTEVRLGAVRLTAIATLEVRDLTIEDLRCEPFLRAGLVRVKWQPGLFWQGFWKGQLTIPLSAVEIEQASIYLYQEQASGLLNLDRLFASDTAPSQASGGPHLSLPYLRLRDCAMIFRDSTASNQDLAVRRGYLNYANLQLNNLSLEASIEKRPGFLFAYVRWLSVADTAAQVQVDTLRLVLRAYADSTVIDYLHLAMGQTQLTAHGKFSYEGLDKLFLSTDTKHFVAKLEGYVDWQDIGAFSGEVLPLRGRWGVHADLEGDLVRLRWSDLEVKLEGGAFLRTRGEVWHYARPKLLHWDVRIRDARLPLGVVSAAIPDVGGWPRDWDTMRVWALQGRSVGSLYSYWFQVHLPSVTGFYMMERREGVWHWQAGGQFSGWSLTDLMPTIPLRQLYGEVTLEGVGFEVGTWTGTVTSALTGLYDTIPVKRLLLSAEASNGLWTGEGTLQSSWASLSVRGRIRWDQAPIFNLSGCIQQLNGDVWGAEGILSADFHSEAIGAHWDSLTGYVRLKRVLWTAPDTILNLGDLALTLKVDPRLLIEAPGLQARLEMNTGWTAFLAQIGAIRDALTAWIEAAEQPVLSDSVAFSQMYLKLGLADWGWLRVLGLPRQIQGGQLELRMDWNAQDWHLALQTDSLLTPWGDLHEIKAQATGRWTDALLSSCWLTIGYGEQYLAFQNLHFLIRSAYPAGTFSLASRIGREDSLGIQGDWQWAGGASRFELDISPGSSYLTLGGERWLFTQRPFLQRVDTQWAWSLRLQSAGAVAFTKREEGKIQAYVQHLPLRPLAEALGEAIPVDGFLFLDWQAVSGGLLTLRVDSLLYGRQQYPRVQLTAQTTMSPIPIQLLIGESAPYLLRGEGQYNPDDQIKPLSFRLSGYGPAEWLSPFVGSYLEKLRGYIRFGRLLVEGSLEQPRLYGDMLLDSVRAYIPFLRLSYMTDGVVRWRGDTLWVPELPLRDPYQKVALLSGHVALQGWMAPYLNLQLRVKEGPLRLLATRSSANAYLYGQALIETGSIEMVGPWNEPQVQGAIRFAEGTDLTLPVESYMRTERRSYVKFVGRRDTMAPSVQAPKGVGVQVALRSAPAARFRVVFDSRTGDEITAAGTSSLFLSITPEGQVSISGYYEVASGEYRFSLRGLVAKKLLIEPGSRITWDGDLYEGRLQITAIYKAFTSLRLIDTNYTATVPVEVQLLLGGTLLQPEFRFQVDIPNLTGNPSPLITLFLQRLQNDEQERNRQVFALMALGTFLPSDQTTSPPQASTGSVNTTLSEFLSAQLAGVIGQAVGGGVGVAFSMGQWNDLSAQIRLSLGGRFTLEREGVLVAPGQANPSLGNLSMRYRVLPKRLTGPTQLQLEAEAFNRQTFIGGQFGSSTQGLGLRLRKSFYLPERRRRGVTPENTPTFD